VGTVVAIHQANFFPWLGYFDKLARADRFIFLDHAQFPKTAGTWSNRVQLLVGHKPRWCTMAIRRDYHGVRRCNEMQTSAQVPWRKDLIQTLRANYGRSRHFAEVFPILEPLIQNQTDDLTQYNIHAIESLAKHLGIDPGKCVRSSTLAIASQATDMLIDLVRAVGGTAYLCGDGSQGYLEPETIARAGVDLIYQAFQHPVYPQAGNSNFTPGLSCLDAVFNCGFEAVGFWLNGTRKQMGHSAA